MAVRPNVHPGDFCAPINSAGSAPGDGLESLRPSAGRPGELRGFARWQTPTLTATIDGHRFRTLNWSLGGVLLANVEEPRWRHGAPVELMIAAPGCPPRTATMFVVRYHPGAKLLAPRGHPASPVLMDVKLDCDTAGLPVA